MTLAATRRKLISAIAMLFVASSAHADANDQKRACLDSSELGQRLRQLGNLLEARTEFLECAKPACPAAVRTDCAQWLAEVESTLPSVVVIARDANGEDLTDVRVTMDGALLAEKLDGKALPVSIGEHVFRLEHAGTTPIIKKILVHEGERARRLEITFTSVAPPPPKPPPPPVTATKSPQNEAQNADTTEPASGSIAPFIVMGAGLVVLASGVITYVAAQNSIPVGCSPAIGVCENYFNDGSATTTFDAPNCEASPSADGCPGSTLNQNRRSNATNASTASGVGVIAMVSGGAIAVGGLVWYFVSRPRAHDDDHAQHAFFIDPFVAPLVDRTNAGATFGARF